MLAAAQGLLFISILTTYLAALSLWNTASSSLELSCAWYRWKKVTLMFQNSDIGERPAAQDVFSHKIVILTLMFLLIAVYLKLCYSGKALLLMSNLKSQLN
jgi:hypothetical protein